MMLSGERGRASRIAFEAMMKGRRKVISHKWSLQAQFEIEAIRALTNRSNKGAQRFLDAALAFGRDLEPVGWLAGNFRCKDDCNPLPNCNLTSSGRQGSDLSELLTRTIEVVIHAGQLLSAEWARNDGSSGQGDMAGVVVDIEQILRQQLLQLFPCDFWGKETGNRLTGHSWCWVVDSNDGTADFLSGLKDSTLSIGLLYEQSPVLGVVFAPVTVEGLPDCIAWAEGLKYVIRNGQPVKTKLSARPLSSEEFVMVSAAARSKPDINADLCKPAGFVAMPSIAYRLAKVAAGDGVCGVSLYPVSAHDVVAGHALLKGACGVLLDEQGQSITYTTKAKMQTVSQRCFGGSISACRELLEREWDRVLLK
jgi:fructose-1,6-bisphosphatase/inositol monophosphatase family enzyme